MSRRTRAREYKPAIAIIGEGETEKMYFTQLRGYEKIAFAVKPELPSHSNINSIMDRAVSLVEDGGYDRVFCVFDLDVINHDRMVKANYKRLKARHNRGKITFIENNPCLEFWFLLHFRQTTREFGSYRQLEYELKRHINDYSKSIRYFNTKKIYAHLKENQIVAKQNAEHSITHRTDTSSISEMHELLTYLDI